MTQGWRSGLESALMRAWRGRGWAAWLLLPWSWIFATLYGLRYAAFHWGLLKTQRVNAFVIVVGNVVAGGAGKTPTVISIAKHLSTQGYRVGVISRGFGRSTDKCLEVFPNSPPHEVGDEPALIARATQLPMFVGRNRLAAASALMERYPQTQIIVSDDGLQHYRLYRDLEICVFDDRACGNGWFLPAGPLREPWPKRALWQAGQSAERLLVLHTGNKPAFAGHTAQRSLSPVGLRQDGSKLALSLLHSPGARPLIAVAAIAQPENFFSMLRALDLPLAHTLALRDHDNFERISGDCYKGYQLVCTEKDAMKLWPKVPDAVAVPLVQTIEPNFFRQLDACIAARLPSALSSEHGHQTT